MIVDVIMIGNILVVAMADTEVEVGAIMDPVDIKEVAVLQVNIKTHTEEVAGAAIGRMHIVVVGTKEGVTVLLGRMGLLEDMALMDHTALRIAVTGPVTMVLAAVAIVITATITRHPTLVAVQVPVGDSMEATTIQLSKILRIINNGVQLVVVVIGAVTTTTVTVVVVVEVEVTEVEVVVIHIKSMHLKFHHTPRTTWVSLTLIYT